MLYLLSAAQVQAKQQTILVLGDSISAAYGMSLEQGWVALMAGRLADSHPGTEVVNASISGETTEGALRRLPALLQQHQPQLVLIELGGNDGLRGFPIGKFRDNLTGLARQSKAAGAQVLILPMEIPPNYGARYTGSFRDSYPLAAETTDSTLAPFILDGIATDPKLMQADGIHPTAAAQALITDTILPTVLEALEDSDY